MEHKEMGSCFHKEIFLNAYKVFSLNLLPSKNKRNHTSGPQQNNLDEQGDLQIRHGSRPNMPAL
jgi:hypothetical protein